MNTVFADTFYFIALLNPKDAAHQRATHFSSGSRSRLLSTICVFTELADGLSRSPNRHLFRMLLNDFENSPHDQLIWPDPALYLRAVQLYDSRPDKEWSLTDCISFAVMGERGVTQTLTADHHFEQAGFVALLKE